VRGGSTAPREVIVVEALTKRYKNGVLALNGIDFAIHEGDVVGYLGPNGAGKTTTMKILTDLIKPTSGRAYIAGVDVQAHPMEALRRVGALIEVPGVYEYLSPKEIMGYFGRIHGLSRERTAARAEEVLARVRLAEWSDAKVGGFSTGMTRRFFIALAMLHDPEVLILDEPVLGLDPKGMQDIRVIIKELAKDGKTVLLSSHLLGEVAETCNRILLIDKGKIHVSDTVENLTTGKASQRITVEFLQPLADAHVADVLSIPGVTRLEMNGRQGTMEYAGGREVVASILGALVAAGLKPVSFALHEASLEELYVAMVGQEGGIH
jgi:ABC-2 type transport system ATP-binding protein